jgi:hypothetical protein
MTSTARTTPNVDDPGRREYFDKMRDQYIRDGLRRGRATMDAVEMERFDSSIPSFNTAYPPRPPGDGGARTPPAMTRLPPLRELAASIDPICFRPWVSRINSTRYPVEGKWTGHYTYATDIRAQRISGPISIEFRAMPPRVEDQVQLEVLGVGDDEAGEFYVHGTVDTSTDEIFLEKVQTRYMTVQLRNVLFFHILTPLFS